MKVVWKFKALYLMMLPIMAYFLVFSYYPLVRGFIISFQEFRLIGNRPFIGFDNYITVLKDHSFWEMMQNTLLLGGGMLVIGFIMPILLALSLNEILQAWFKKVVQMIVYIPHLFSWVVVGGMWILMLSPDTGIVNAILKLVGVAKPITFMASADSARWVMVLTSVWKEMGFICILYLATIVAINPALYEAARMDGANRWQLVRYVTLPSLVSTMKVVIMLNVLSILRIFDQIIVMRNGAIAKKVDVIMMYTYHKGILEFKVGLATSAGFLVIFATLLITFVTRAIIRYDEG
ncbi:sugar ABC transporter permease [Paenibacillus sp. CGMCC 1.16610]|uniref:ABC transporter permease subunit n=1 Tax=Paenibacillus anseongense TaxID=2682845 RepID=A0ABW9UNK3_9BACL|nr:MULTISPECIES: ABC transporter permease subunit [Paenibacillus]MBA2941486.1 sugar ABC transporter permease [Paenibacillus sp. CGMCC 1.16610]MVQ40303.1 ABC transporter permease subunit [Paenibacillus anseongense]